MSDYIRNACSLLSRGCRYLQNGRPVPLCDCGTGTDGQADMAEQGRIGLKQVLFEFIRVGKAVRVNAIDPATGIEVSMVGDPKVGAETLKRLATRKLEYVIAKRLQEER